MGQLKNATIGQRVLVWVSGSPGDYHVVCSKGSGTSALEATVLDTGSYATVLGWYAGEEHPSSPEYSIVGIQPDWTKMGIVEAREYGSHVEYEPCDCPKNAAGKIAGKTYTDECPCGIHPSRCIYHKV